MPPISPDTLLQQRYRILNLLGEGDFGRTYLATDNARTSVAGRPDADEYCEIQEFIPSTQVPGAVAKAKEFFKQQAILLYQLQYPQIPRFWATFEEQDRLFLVLDYTEGKTYAQLLSERRDTGRTFSEAEVGQLLIQVLPALGYIHSKGVVHREISPDNIISRSRDGLPVPSEFGVVKEFAERLHSNTAVEPLGSGTDPHRVKSGKPGYAPAEQIERGQILPNSDLYALAVTAIVLLTGKEPSALFTNGRMNWDWRNWTQISDGFAAVLERMLDPDPNARYQAAIEAYRDIQALNLPTSPLPTAPAAPAAPAAASNRLSEMPTVAVGASPTPTAPNRIQSAITQLNAKSIWENPRVFIPLGILISLLAGLGSWLVVSNLLHNKSAEPTASTPPKQIDFNNPTIPTGNSATPTDTTDTIQPVLDSAVIKEGKVDATKPIRYKIAATSGQNLDIQLLPISSTSDPSKSPAPNASTQPSPTATGIGSPIGSIPTAVPTQSPKSTTTPAGSIAPITATQILLSVLSPTGSPIDAQAERVVGWRGQITTPGDYTIELRPIAGLAGGSFPYKLSVTQLSSIPSSSPSPESSVPSTGSTPPLGIPVPSGGNGINPSPSISPSPTSSDNNGIIPTVTPTPVATPSPNVSPSSTQTESERPARRRRARRRIEPESSPQVRQRNRVSTNNEETPTPRRRRQVDSSNDETPTPRRRRQVESSNDDTPTPRRRRRRVANTETQSQPTPASTPQTDRTESTNSPKPEPIEVPSPKPEPIAVPSPRSNSVPSATPAGGGDSESN